LTRLRYRIVDVFSARPLAGNQLCVVLDPCPESLMQAITREMNLSETTFPTVTADGAYDVRIFTPGMELPFAGHPSLGTAWTLGPQQWTQKSAGATVVIDADAEGAVMTQPDPAFTDVDHVALVAALGLPGAEAASTADVGGMLFTIVATDAPIDALAPQLPALKAAADAAGGIGVAVVRRIADAELHVRVFLPGAGVPEDPGTGSAAGAVALFARRMWGTAVDVEIRQGDEMGRPCRIDVHAEAGAVRVGGRVSGCAEGTLTL
jgi:trans-2,3-dihydro-3-hydroxyanthranilate isomerase